MADVVQRDWITELEDAKRVDSVEVQAVVNRLPTTELIPLPEVAEAFDCSPATVEALYLSGDLRGVNLGTRSRRFIKISRTSIITYLKKELN